MDNENRITVRTVRPPEGAINSPDTHVSIVVTPHEDTGKYSVRGRLITAGDGIMYVTKPISASSSEEAISVFAAISDEFEAIMAKSL